MGGDKKKTSYQSLNHIIRVKVKLLVLIGENCDQIDSEISVNIKKKLFKKLEDAVEYIFNEMQSGDTVLFSPGSSSFYKYNNYKVRGNHFKKIINDYVYSQD